jgi:hypothetical protein
VRRPVAFAAVQMMIDLQGRAPRPGVRIGWRVLALPLALALIPRGAAAQPSIPATFYGSAGIDGAPAPPGATVRALIDGTDCTQANSGEIVLDGPVAAYVVTVVHESQQPGCGRAGKTVTFAIAGRTAAQTATWSPGPHQLDLNAGSGRPSQLPTSTPTSTRAPATASPSVTPVPGTAIGAAGGAGGPSLALPTDDIRLPFQLTPRAPGAGATAPPSLNNGNDSDSSLLLPIAVVLGCVLAAGGVGGMLLARRPRRRD